MSLELGGSRVSTIEYVVNVTGSWDHGYHRNEVVARELETRGCVTLPKASTSETISPTLLTEDFNNTLRISTNNSNGMTSPPRGHRGRYHSKSVDYRKSRRNMRMTSPPRGHRGRYHSKSVDYRKSRRNTRQSSVGFRVAFKTTASVFGSLLHPKKMKYNRKKKHPPDPGSTRDNINQSHDNNNEDLNFTTEGNLHSLSKEVLVKRLTPTPTYFPDQQFLYTCLLCCRLYERSSVIMSHLHKEVAIQLSLNCPDQRLLLKRFTQLLEQWISFFPADFLSPAGARQFTTVCEFLTRLQPDLKKPVANLHKSLTAHREKLDAYLELCVHEESQCEEASLRDICTDANVFAEQLLLLEIEKLSILTCDQFIAKFAHKSLLKEENEVTEDNNIEELGQNNSSKNENTDNSADKDLISRKKSKKGRALSLKKYKNKPNDSKSISDNSSNDSLTKIDNNTNNSTQKTNEVKDSSLKNKTINSSSTKLPDRTRSVIDIYASWFDRLSHLVATEVCTCPKKVDRIKAINFFVEVGKICLKLGNYNSLMALLNGLNKSAVARMRRTWLQANRSAFIRLEKELSPANNFSRYRESIVQRYESSHATIVPLFAILVKDMTFINEGLPTILPNKLVNYGKFSNFSKELRCIEELKRAKRTKLSRNEQVIDYLKHASVCNEEGLYKSSFEVEPPDSSFERDRFVSVRARLKKQHQPVARRQQKS